MTIRRATKADARPLHALYVANRAWLEPFQPGTDPDRRYQLAYHRDWVGRPGRYVILDEGEIAGGLSLVVTPDDAMRSAMLGYWVAEDRGGRGLATQAVREALELAYGELGLHRVEAGTRVDNVRSQRVLEKCGFTRVGVLRQHLLIDGVWRDHYLYERLATDP
jgi:[ribosomal protein S5]-alanine N-acetyltransferase